MGLISFSCTDLDEEIFSEITTDIKIVIIFMRRW